MLNENVLNRLENNGKVYRTDIDGTIWKQGGEIGNTIQSLRVGRNESCPCGSGKKYKQCCGR